jgi:uncharacterized protein (TIGR02145 family)
MNGFWFCVLIVLGSAFTLVSSCRKDPTPDTIQPPVVVTANIYFVKQGSAFSGGDVTSDGGEAVKERGVCWSTMQNPATDDSKTINGIGTGIFTSEITGLTASTGYYLRAYATNSIATGYGNELFFKTYTGTVNDIEGNIYNTITIGAREWMAENLKTTRYNDNTAIPLVADFYAWAELSSSGYCWYNNDAVAFGTDYGVLYNWYTLDAASNGGKNVCPAGWHVPSDAEWTELSYHMGGDSIAGGKMKETGTAHWQSPNTRATNESGFRALPGGGRYYDGFFSSLGKIGGWWSSTELLATTARGRFLYYDLSLVYRGSGSKNDGFSVRCVRNN